MLPPSPEGWHGVCLLVAIVEAARDRAGSATLPRAVVVEGDVALRRLLAHTLERSGFQVLSGADEMALERHLEGEDGAAAVVDLLVADVDTPGGASPATLVQIRQRMPHLSVVIIGPLGDASVGRIARRIGAHRVLEKPFDLTQLSQFARSAVSGRAAADGEGGGAHDSTQGAA
jgi:DNA-binding NtrC family response regulator